MVREPKKGSMWEGARWQRTQRIAGMGGLFVFGALDSALTSFNVPALVYTGMFTLIGLGELANALARLGEGGPKQ